MMPMMANNFQNALAQRALALPQNAAPQPQPAQMQTTMMPLATHIQPGAQPVGAPQFNGGPMQAMPGPQIPRNSLRSRLGMPSTM